MNVVLSASIETFTRLHDILGYNLYTIKCVFGLSTTGGSVFATPGTDVFKRTFKQEDFQRSACCGWGRVLERQSSLHINEQCKVKYL